METQTLEKHVLQVMDTTGDTTHSWDPDNETEVTVARNTFNELKKKGYLAFRVKGKEGLKGELIKEFDPEARRLTLSPPIVGG